MLLHMMAGSKEDAETVTAFFEDMKRRGLNDPLLVTSDGAPAIEVCFPRAARQRWHAVVEDFAGNAADRLKRGDVTAQHRLQILMKDEASPDQPGVAEHHREQPNNALDAGLVNKSTTNWAKAPTCACSPGGVSKRTSKPVVRGGRKSRKRSVIAVYPP